MGSDGIKPDPETRSRCRNYSKYEPEVMKEDFRNVNWEQVYNTNDVNEALTCFNRTVKAIFDRHAPQIVKRVKGKPCPWMNSDIRKMMTSRDRMLRKARRTKKEEHWNLYKKLRNQCNNKMKYAESSFQKFWRRIQQSPGGFGIQLRTFFLLNLSK